MENLRVTNHAAKRIAQRGMKLETVYKALDTAGYPMYKCGANYYYSHEYNATVVIQEDRVVTVWKGMG